MPVLWGCQDECDNVPTQLVALRLAPDTRSLWAFTAHPLRAGHGDLCRLFKSCNNPAIIIMTLNLQIQILKLKGEK